MKIFLTGASGLVGAAFALAARRRGHTVVGIQNSFQEPVPGISHTRHLDLTNLDQLTGIVLEEFPDAIVNTAALSRPADCAADPTHSEQLNVELPRALARLAHHLSCRILHLSTDLVFDGAAGPYRSQDPVSPKSRYGEDKYRGEQAVLQAAPAFATVLRIPLLTGNSPRGMRSAHESLFQRWQQGETVILSDEEIRQPTSASNVAEVLLECLERNDVAGRWHWAGRDQLSRYAIGQEIARHFKIPAQLIRKAPASGQPTRRITFEISPLRGKLKTPALSFAAQLEEMVVPVPTRPWFHQLPPLET